MAEREAVASERAALAALLGGHAPTSFRLQARTPVTSGPGWRAERLDLQSPGGLVRGFLTGPDADWAALPAVLYCHAHGNRYEIGAAELLEGRPALLDESYGVALARRGIVALCPDMPCFGERATETESSLSKRLLWQGRTLFGAMLSDLAGALDLLSGLDGIDPARISIFGFSMGAAHAFWLGALQPRIERIAHACSFADLASLVAGGGHDLHGHYMTVPGLLASFSTGAIAGVIAPRPQLVIAGALDPLTPPDALAKGLADLEQAYRDAGASAALRVLVEPDTGHRETPAMREAILDFLCG
jgi:dienelactone hydrolase